MIQQYIYHFLKLGQEAKRTVRGQKVKEVVQNQNKGDTKQVGPGAHGERVGIGGHGGVNPVDFLEFAWRKIRQRKGLVGDANYQLRTKCVGRLTRVHITVNALYRF